MQLTSKISFFSNRPVSGSHHKSIEEDEAEFEGDPALELVSDEKAQELEAPAWAAKIMSYVQQKGKQEAMLLEISDFFSFGHP